ncbi:MAG: cadherin-like domain-containing protein [Acidobacteria bacterium]|nr:cadherin-like domain-containing protein [Acidobacteriota bacterium]
MAATFAILSPEAAGAQGVIANGESYARRITGAGDVDVWTFTATQGESLAIAVGEVDVPPGTPDPLFHPWLRITDPAGVLTVNTNDARAAVAVIPAPLTGTYIVEVAAYAPNASYGTAGDYRLTLALGAGAFTVPAGDEGGAMTNGVHHVGRIEQGDIDMWSFTATQGDDLHIKLGEIPVAAGAPDPNFHVWLRIVGPNGALVAGNLPNPRVSEANLMAAQTGIYTAVVLAQPSAIFGTTGDYRVTLARAPGAFTVPSGDDGGPLTNGVTHLGRIDQGDIDMWSFTATQGDSVQLKLGEVPVASGTPDPMFRPWMRVVGPAGTAASSIIDTRVAQSEFTAAVTGTYTVTASAFAPTSVEATTGDYRLTLARTPGVYQVPTGDEGGLMTDGITYTARIDQGDIDMWSFSVCQNQPVTVRMTEIPSVPDPQFYPWLAINGPTGGLVTLQTNASASVGTFTATVPGLYTVRAAAYTPNNIYATSGDYTIRVEGACSPPTSTNDGYAAVFNTALTVPAPGVLANDTSPSGAVLSAALVAPPASGSVSLNANGSFTYPPNTGFAGADSFTYRASSSAGSSGVATVTISVAPAPTTVQAPTNVYAYLIAGNVVTLRWTPPATGPVPATYILEGGVTPGQTLAALPTGSGLPVFTFTAPNGAFYLRLKSAGGGQTSAASNEIRVFVNQPVAPSAPANLLGLADGSVLGLTWRQTFGGGTPTGAILDVSGPVSASLPLAATESFSFSNVPAGTFTFSLRAANTSGTSPSSNSVTLAFPGGCTGVPQTPAGFLAYNVGNTLHVLWEPPSSGAAVSGYVLNVSGAFTGTFPLPLRGLSAPVPPGTYTFTVRAVNSCGSSPATAPQTVVVP